MKLKRILFLLFLILAKKYLVAQNDSVIHVSSAHKIEINCKNATQLVVCPDGIPYVASKSNQYFEKDLHPIVFYPEHRSSSIWYKIKTLGMYDLNFTVKALATNDVYNFVVFQAKSGVEFCENVMTAGYVPVRLSLANELGLTETGLKKMTEEERYSIEHDPSSIYKNPYLSSIMTNPGDEYYLVVHHQIGNENGHVLQVGADQYILSIEATEKDSIVESKIGKEITIKPTFKSCEEVTLEYKNAVVEYYKKVRLYGEVIDEKSNKPIKDAWVTIINTTKGTVEEIKTNNDGKYSFALDKDEEVSIEIHKVGYIDSRKKEKISADYTLVSKMKQVEIGEKFILKNVFFHSGTYAFQEESKDELDFLVDFMLVYPKVKIEIHGHTNGDGKVYKNDAYAFLGPEWNFEGNQDKLSKLRADALKKYLVENGIDENRMKTKGFGGKKMMYPNPRTQYQKDRNKRVEIILKER